MKNSPLWKRHENNLPWVFPWVWLWQKIKLHSPAKHFKPHACAHHIIIIFINLMLASCYSIIILFISITPFCTTENITENILRYTSHSIQIHEVYENFLEILSNSAKCCYGPQYMLWQTTYYIASLLSHIHVNTNTSLISRALGTLVNQPLLVLITIRGKPQDVNRSRTNKYIEEKTTKKMSHCQLAWGRHKLCLLRNH